jgi:homoserine kinase
MKPELPVRVRVPASSANLGSGFDTLGLGLSLYNYYDVLEFLPEGEYDVEVIGEGLGEIVGSANNMVISSYETACKEWGIAPRGLRLRSLNAIPLCRGLGSSAGAVVSGVVIANMIRDVPLPREELLELMTRIEGHPDNVVPCCLGGMVVSCWDGEHLRHVRLDTHPGTITAVVAVPDVRVSTAHARSVLPETVSLQDAVFNVGRVALFAASWATGKWDELPWAMDDRLHQQFRARLFPGGEAILEKVRSQKECLGVAISGSGPSVLAFVTGDPQPVAESMCRIFSEHGVRSRFFVLDVDDDGALVLPIKG